MKAYSNCLIFALMLLWRRRGRRGYLKFRKSDWGHFPHAMYEERHHVVGYVPISPKRHFLPPPIFKGRVKWGDQEIISRYLIEENNHSLCQPADIPGE